MLVHVHVAPSPLGDERGDYSHVEAAIAIIAESGLTYEVGALGTTIQGHPDAVWDVLRQLHEACLTSGANQVMTHVRILETHDDGDLAPMSELVARIQ